MSAAPALQYISIEDYLEEEEQALEKHEYYQGEIFAMAGASHKHNRLVRDCLVSVSNYLEDKTCEILPSDIRVHIEANTLTTYPDLSIYCNPIDYYKNRTDTVTNPTVIIEVLSPSNKDYDRGTKFLLYRDLPSLKEYILISSTEMLVEKYTRQTGNEWKLKDYKKPEDEFMIQAIQFTMNVGTLYRNITFDEPKKTPRSVKRPRPSKQ